MTAAASTPKTDQETCQAAVDDFMTRLMGGRLGSPAAISQAVGDAVAGALLGERKRIVDWLNGQAHGAAAAARAEPHVPQHKMAAAFLAGLAQRLAQPPGAAVCPVCRGSKRVASPIVTAAGQQRALPCPACAAPAEGSAP